MKKTNNKGFSLVELIVVVAIMAVLIGVLAPQFLRYVEKSRLQKDNSAIGEIANAVKIASADETVNNAIGDTDAITPSGKAYSFSASGNALEKELNKVLGASVTLTSNKYATAPTISITKADGIVTVTASIYEKPDDTATKTVTY